mgnify:CR=1 FL=1
MSIVAIIPARGGSVRISRKNLAPCAAKPLLAWTAEAACGARTVDYALLSTDDTEIAATGRELGLEVPFLRPGELANSAAEMLGVLRHSLEWLRANLEGEIEALVLLQPTSPLRTARHIDEAVADLRRTGAETVVSVTPVPHQFHPLKALRLTEDGLETYLADAPEPGLGTGGMPPAYGRNGPAVLVTRPSVIERGKLYGRPCLPYVMPPEASIDIDEPLDLTIAECLLMSRQRGETTDGTE